MNQSFQNVAERSYCVNPSKFKVNDDVLLTLGEKSYPGWVDEIKFSNGLDVPEYTVRIVLEWEGEPFNSDHKKLHKVYEVDELMLVRIAQKV